MLFIGVLAVLFSIPVALYYFTVRNQPSGPNILLRQKDTYAPTPTHPLANDGLGSTRVIRTSVLTATYLWVYGRVVSVDEEMPDGLKLIFTIDGDPFSTRLPVVLSRFGDLYQVFQYQSQFGNARTKTGMKLAELKKTVEEGSPLVELRIPFPSLSPDEEALMAALEAANRGSWQNLPKDRLIRAESIGIVMK